MCVLITVDRETGVPDSGPHQNEGSSRETECIVFTSKQKKYMGFCSFDSHYTGFDR